MEEYEDDYETACPHCGSEPTRRKDCDNILCDDGYEDMYDDDPINHPEPGEDLITCGDCHGTGRLHWCPKCGKDILPTDDDD